MSNLPATDYLTDSARTEGEFKAGLESFLAGVKELPGGAAETTLTIAGGFITPTAAIHSVDTESGAASDDLANINQASHPDGRLLLIRCLSGSRAVVVKHSAGGTGQISLQGGADLTLNDTKNWLLLKRTGSLWEEVLSNFSYQSPSLSGTPTAPTAAAETNTTQIATAAFVQREIGILAECRLTKSGSNLLLSRCNGSRLFIAGQSRSIPSGGVTLAPTGLTASTTYYIYAYMNSGTMTLEASTTTHVTDATYGHETKSGDSTRTLVGMARTITGPAWADSATQRLVISYFNRRPISATTDIGTDKITSSTSHVQLGTTQIDVLAWGDNSTITVISGSAFCGTASAYAYLAVGLNGSTVGKEIFQQSTSAYGAYWHGGGLGYEATLTEGYNYYWMMGKTSTGTSYFGQVQIFVTIWG